MSKKSDAVDAGSREQGMAVVVSRVRLEDETEIADIGSKGAVEDEQPGSREGSDRALNVAGVGMDSAGKPDLQTGRLRRRLSKKDKLRFKSQFDQMKRDGEKLVGSALLVVVYPSPSGHTECGVICGKKYSLLAVRRNRARRLLWESFRLLRGEIQPPTRMVLIPRRRLGEYSRQQTTRELAKLLARRGLISAEVAESPPEC